MIRTLLIALVGCLMFYAVFADENVRATEPTKKPKRTPKEPKHDSTIVYCQGCRKQKEHTVLVPGIYKCTSCGRITDLT